MHNNMNVNVSGPVQPTSTYKTKVLKGNHSFASQVTESNTKYVIKYNFDLGGENITIPSDCVLEFDGGSISGGNIIGQNTSIAAADYNIFKYDRKQHYIDGSWNIDYWRSAWFGAIPDGSIELDSNYEATFNGTDNYGALQTVLDAAFKTTCKNVLISRGSYRISKGLNVGWYDQSYISIVSDYNCELAAWAGDDANPVKILYDGTEYAININGGYGTCIKGVSVVGKNVGIIRKNGEGLYLIEDIINRNTYNSDERKYSTSAVNNINTAYSTFSPYAGIITDAYSYYNPSTGYSLPELPAFISEMSNMAYSVRVKLECVSICGFVVGYGISLSQNIVMNEYFKTEKCFIFSNVYAISISTTNGRNTVFRDCYIRGNYCCFTNNRFAKSKTVGTPGVGYPLFENCSFDHSFEIVEYNTEGHRAIFSHCYGEYIYTIGKTYSRNIKPFNLKFEDCTFLFKAKEDSGSGIPSTYFNGCAEFIGCELRSYEDGYIMPLSIGSGVLHRCIFKAFKHGDTLYNKASSLIPVRPFSINNSDEHIYTSIFSTSANIGEIYNRSSFIDAKGRKIQMNFLSNYIRSTAEGGTAIQQFNSQTGILSLSYNWYTYKQIKFVPGDILYPYNTGENCFDTPIFLIIEVNSSNLAETEVKAVPVSGYKIENNEYVLNTININNVTIPNSYKDYWMVYITRNMELHSPINVMSVSDNTITAKDDLDSYVSIGDSFEIITAETPDISDSTILAKENKTIKFMSCTADKGLLCWITKSYLGSKFWGIFNSSGNYVNDSPVARIIKESPYSYSLTLNTTAGSNVIIKDKRGISYGYVSRDGTSKTIKLPKNTYILYDCESRTNITTVALFEDTSITI